MDVFTLSATANGDAAAAIQEALDAGRPVVITAGTYRIERTILLPSGARIEALDGAVIRLADGACRERDDYLLKNANPAEGDADIEVSGGVWDGNNRGNPRPDGLFADGYTGTMFHFENVDGLRVANLVMQNAEAYHLRATAVRNFTIESIAFASECVRHNNDGIHLGGECSDGVIRDIVGLHAGVTADDLVALNADDALDRNEVRGMRSGPIRRLRIEHLRAEGCHCFVRLLSVYSPIEDVEICDVEGTCTGSAINCDAARGCRVPVFDEADPPFANGVGLLKNVTVRRIRVAKSVADASPLLRLETRCSVFVVEQFTREHDESPDTPTVRIQHVPGTRVTVDGESFVAGDDSFVSHAGTVGRLTLES